MSSIQEYSRSRQAAIAAGKPPHSIMEIKHTSYQDVQKFANIQKSGVTLGQNNCSFHNIVWTNQAGETKQAYFNFANAVLNINGIGDTAEKTFGNQPKTGQPAQPQFVKKDVEVEITFIPSPEKQNNDPAALAELNGVIDFDTDACSFFADKLAAGQVSTASTKISSSVQRKFSMKTMVTDKAGQSMANKPLEIPIIRASMKFPKVYDPNSKVPYVEVYDVRKSFETMNKETGEIKWVHAEHNGSRINGSNWNEYITYASKIWMMDYSFKAIQSSLSMSVSLEIRRIAILHVPVSREAKTTLTPVMMGMLEKLALTDPTPVVRDEDDVADGVDAADGSADPLMNPIMGKVGGPMTTGASAVVNNLATLTATTPAPAQSFQMPTPAPTQTFQMQPYQAPTGAAAAVSTMFQMPMPTAPVAPTPVAPAALTPEQAYAQQMQQYQLQMQQFQAAQAAQAGQSQVNAFLSNLAPQ